MYGSLSVTVNMHEALHSARRSWTHFVCVCVHVCGRQKPNYPNWSSTADDAITRGGTGVLGSLFYICYRYSENIHPAMFNLQFKLKMQQISSPILKLIIKKQKEFKGEKKNNRNIWHIGPLRVTFLNM